MLYTKDVMENKYQKEGISYTDPVGRNAKRRAFASLVQSEELIELFSDTLNVQDMPEDDSDYALVWKIALDYYTEYDKLLELDHFAEQIQDETSENYALVTDEQYQELIEFIAYASSSDFKLKPNWTKATLRAYLKGIHAAAAAEKMVRGGSVLENISNFLEESSDRLGHIDSIGKTNNQLFFPEGWANKVATATTPTPFKWANSFMDGGERHSEVYGIIAPYGTCKTTLVVQLAVDKARSAHVKWLEARKANKKVPYEIFVLASYEATIEELRERALGYGAQIPRSRMEHLTCKEDYTRTVESMRPYEKKLNPSLHHIKAQGGSPLLQPEWQRSQSIIPALNNHLVILNAISMTEEGNHRSVQSAMLGINEIRTAIETKKRMIRKQYGDGFPIVVSGIALDYLNALMQLVMEKHDLPSDQLRSQIDKFPLKVKSKLAMHFKCPVWIMQQYKGAAQDSHPLAEMSHADAAECKTFGQNLDFCFTIGNKLMQDGQSLVVVQATKTRRTQGKARKVLQIDGDMNRVIYRSDLYVDEETRSISFKGQGGSNGIADVQHGTNNSQGPPTGQAQLDI